MGTGSSLLTSIQNKWPTLIEDNTYCTHFCIRLNTNTEI
jgi:hypothetical protein